MRDTSQRRYIVLAAILFAAVLSACNLPPIPGDLLPGPTATPTLEPIDDIAAVPDPGPIYVESNMPESFEACEDAGLNLVASYEIEPEGIMHVIIRYRLNGGTDETTSPWTEYVMAPEGILDALDHFRFEYPELGSDSAELFGDQAGVFEYSLQAVDNDANISYWPGEGPGDTIEVPIEPCGQDQEAQPQAYQIHTYGVSSTNAGYGRGCSPTVVEFEIILSGFDMVDGAWLRYEYMAPINGPAIVSPSFETPLQNMGEGQGFPGSTRLATEVDIGAEANNYMAGSSGYLGWNMYVRLNDQQVFEYPQGGPPLVTIQSCIEPTATPLSLIPIIPTATPTRAIITVLPTATPTPGSFEG